jgi:hypothetical protein
MPTHVMWGKLRIKQTRLAITAIQGTHAKRIEAANGMILSVKPANAGLRKYDHESFLREQTTDDGVVVIPRELPRKHRNAIRSHLARLGFDNLGCNTFKRRD